MPRFTPALRWWPAVLVLLVIGGAAGADEDLRGQVLDLLREGRTEEALPLCRRYVAERPGDATMLYNLACLEAAAGQAEAAVDALREAADAGFADLERAEEDPDLASLAEHPGFVELLANHRAQLTLLSTERGADLALGVESPALALGTAASIRLTWQPAGLQIEVTGGGTWGGLADAGAAPPWQDGPGLVVTLAIPDDGAPYRSGNHWVFAFGLDKGGPAGALYLPGPGLWQRILELDPKLRLDGDRLHLRALLPWATIMPFHPLVDSPLGFNATLRARDPAGDGWLEAGLMPDPRAFEPTTPARRVARLEFDPASLSDPAFLGRVDDSISRGRPLDVDLVAVSPVAGRGRLVVDFLDGARNSVMPGGPGRGGLDLAVGVTRVARQTDFSGLRSGPYLLRAELEFPDGELATWSTTILHLAPDWSGELARRIDALRPEDQPTARHVLARIEDALADHRPRRNPGPLATTLGQLETMLGRAEEAGTLVPETGSFLVVYPGAGGEDQLCRGYLPEPLGPDSRLVLVLHGYPGHEPRLVERIQQFYTHGAPLGAGQAPHPVFLVPAAGADAEVALDWARVYFGRDRVDLAGIDAAGGTALKLAAARPEATARLMVAAGGGLEPWPGADGAELAGHLAGLADGLAVTWLDFPLETRARGQAPLLRQTLDDLGTVTVEDVPVRGGLEPTQALDRMVLWAEAAPGR